MRDLALAMGDTVDAAMPFEEPSVRAKTSGGLKYLLLAVDCPRGGRTGCRNLLMQVRYSADDRVALDRINAANIEEASVGTWWDKDAGIVGFTRFLHLDGGVTWANLKSNLAMLLSAARTAGRVVWSEGAAGPVAKDKRQIESK